MCRGVICKSAEMYTIFIATKEVKHLCSSRAGGVGWNFGQMSAVLKSETDDQYHFQLQRILSLGINSQAWTYEHNDCVICRVVDSWYWYNLMLPSIGIDRGPTRVSISQYHQS